MRRVLPMLPVTALLLLLSSVQELNAACCTNGQPTYQGSGTNFVGIPTCSDGPCSGEGFDYLSKGAVESPTPDSCCDTDNGGGFIYNPPAGSGKKWPGIQGFPNSFEGTGRPCSKRHARFRCKIAGAESSATIKEKDASKDTSAGDQQATQPAAAAAATSDENSMCSEGHGQCKAAAQSEVSRDES